MINKSWYWTKILFLCLGVILGAYGYGTFNPNEYAEKKIFAIMDKFKKDVHMFQKKLDSFTDADGVEWSGYEYIGVKK